MEELIFVPGLIRLVIGLACIFLLLSALNQLDKWLSSQRRRKRDKAANWILESKRHGNFDLDYLSQIEADMRMKGIAIDTGFLASLSGEKYVN